MNLKLKSADVRFILFILVILLLTFSKSFAVTKTSTGSTAWNTASTWSPSGIPASGDDVIILDGHNISVSTAAATCNSLTFNTGSTTTTLTLSNRGLTVTGAITFSGASGSAIKSIVMAANAITCGSIVMPNTTGTAITRINSTTGTLTVSGNITLSGDVVGENVLTSTNTGQFLSIGGNFVSLVTVNLGSGGLYLTGSNNQSICSFSQSSATSRFRNNKTGGTATMTGNFTCGLYRFGAVGGILDLGAGFTHTILGVVEFNTGGTLNCNSSILNLTSSTAYTGTLGTINTNTSTINYNGTAQTIIPITYYNLTLSTSGIKIFPTGTTTVNGNLTLEGTATTTVTGTLTFGASSGLIYNKTTHTTEGEWPATFNGSGGVTIQSGTVTLAAAKVLGTDDPLTIASGATLTTTASNFSLTFGGNFIKNGTLTANASNIIINSTATTQSIDGFTTTGTVSMTKTAGTATFTGNVSGAAFTLDGTGGTLNLGSGLNHTFTGTFTSTNGTLNGGSSTLNISGTTAGTGGSFTASTSTVNYSAAGSQTIFPLTYYNLSLSTSGAKTFNTGTTTVNGNLTLGGSATITFTGTLTYGASAGLVYNKTTHTKGNEWPSPFVGTAGVTIQSGTVTLSDATSISSELDVNTGATLASGGFLTLTSTASSTARLGTATGTITGDVTVERFIPGGVDKRKWRFLSSPVNVSGSIALSQLIDNILITAPAGSAAGFDVNPLNPTNTASLRTYNEATSGSSNNGWTDPTNITNTITTGMGMEVFVRGSRSLTDPYLNWTTPDDVTIDYVGALNTGSISPAITYTPSVGGATTADGFNLVGNPYASSIDFTSTGLTLTNVDDKFWSYNPNTGSYGIYDAGLNDSTNSITRYIASGQAFFIRANAASPIITFTEAIKVAATGNNYFKGNASQATHPILRIKISNDSLNADEALIVLDESASCNTGDVHDAGKLFNDALNIYTVSDDHSNLTINALPCIRNIDTIKVSVFSYNGSNIMTTPHHLEFCGMSSFPNSKYIYLKDEYTNTLTNLNSTSTYDFNITADAASWGNSRFKLLFANSSLGLNSAQLNNTIELFPNPASTEINLKFNTNTTDDLMTYQIVDVLGKVVLEGTSDVQNQIAKINIESVSNGQYILRSTTNSTTTTIRFVK